MDHSYQYITERPYKGNGTTVSDSRSHREGTVTTELGGKTELEKKILSLHLTSPTKSAAEIAREVACDRTYVWRVINRANDNEYYQKDGFEDLTENASKVIWIRAADPEKTQRAIAKQVGVSEGYASRILNNNPHLIERARESVGPYCSEE